MKIEEAGMQPWSPGVGDQGYQKIIELQGEDKVLDY